MKIFILAAILSGCFSNKPEKPKVEYITCNTALLKACGMEPKGEKRLACAEKINPKIFKHCKGEIL